MQGPDLCSFMKLVEVNTKQAVDQFHALPFEIYKDDSQWVAHLRQDVEKVFDPKKNKIFAEGGEAIRWLLYDDSGACIGRVAAFVNPRVLGTSPLKAGGMGFFECIHDNAAAFLLFDTCAKWLKGKGMEAMDGPINFGDRNQYWGCQVTNWDEPPLYLMNHSRPYYRSFFEAYGFGTYFEQYVYWRDIAEKPQPIFYRKYQQYCNDPDIRISNVKGMKTEEIAAHFREVYNSAWGGHSHFKPMTSEAALKIMKAMKPVIDPRIIVFVYYKEKPIAFFVNLPELNQIFCHVNGNLNLLGKLKFLYYKNKQVVNRMTGIVFGVVKEWQGKGIEAAMIVWTSEKLIAHTSYRDTVLSWIGDFNPKMIKVATNLGATLWRTFITYRYQFDRTIPLERAP